MAIVKSLLFFTTIVRGSFMFSFQKKPFYLRILNAEGTKGLVACWRPVLKFWLPILHIWLHWWPVSRSFGPCTVNTNISFCIIVTAIRHKESNWAKFLMQDLKGAVCAPAHLFHRVGNSPPPLLILWHFHFHLQRSLVCCTLWLIFCHLLVWLISIESKKKISNVLNGYTNGCIALSCTVGQF